MSSSLKTFKIFNRSTVLTLLAVLGVYSIIYIRFDNEKSETFIKTDEDFVELGLRTPHPIIWSRDKDKIKRNWEWEEVFEVGGADGVERGSKIFVYSAYIDYIKGNYLIRIISVSPTHSKQSLYCFLFDEELNYLSAVPSEIKLTKSTSAHLLYSPSFIKCNLGAMSENREILNATKYVALSPSKSPQMFSNLLSVTPFYDETVAEEPHVFGACIQPTFNKYDEVFEFTQWIEYYKLMGVGHFTFYNISIGPRVSCVMKSLALKGQVLVLNWTIPIPSVASDLKPNEDASELVHVNGQISQENDCIMRYRGVSKYTVNVDLDEYIIPNYLEATNLLEIISPINQEREAECLPKAAQYQFRSQFFGVDFPPYNKKSNDPKNEECEHDLIQVEDLILYKKVLRTSELFPYDVRSKHISVSKLVVEPGIHVLREAVSSSNPEIKIDPQIATLHHYRGKRRDKRMTEDKESKEPIPSLTQADLSGHAYTSELLARVRKTLKELKNVCDIVL